MPYTDAYVDHVFSYHPPTDGQPEIYETIRSHAKAFFKVINQLVPDGADKADALRSLRNAVMTANAGVALAQGPEAFMVPATRKGKAAAEPVEATRSPYQTTAGFEPVQRDDGYTELVRKSGAGTKGKPMDTMVGDYLTSKNL